MTDSREVRGGECEQRRRDEVGGDAVPRSNVLKRHLISHCMLVTGSE